MDQDSEMDIISKAFQWDCDLFLQKVFLHLDPYSLKSCRQVMGETLDYITIQQYDLRSAENGMSSSEIGYGGVHTG